MQDTVELAPEHCPVTTKFHRDRHVVPQDGNNTTHVFNPGRTLGTVGDYDLVQQLGRCMFVGLHRVTQQAFAVRLLDPVPPGRPELIGRQLIAARSIASIDHPNVVRTIEVGLHEGRVYMVMEYLRGVSLASVIQLHGALSITQVIRVGAHVARGLDAVHQRGVTHRNLDAATAIVVPSENGRSTIKLVEFEIAPSPDVVRIARHSMSPELVGGGEVDHRTDLYSLGVLLHLACTAKNPYEGSPIEILAMHRFRSMVRTAPALEGVPAELAATIQRCLAIEPADRYQSASQVIEALRHASGELARRARPEAEERPTTPLLADPDQLPTESRPSARQLGTQPGAPAPAPAPAPVSALAPAPFIVAPPPSRAAPLLPPSPSSRPSLPPLSSPSPLPIDDLARSGRVLQAIDAPGDSSGVLIAPSVPGRIVTAVQMDSGRTAKTRQRRALPWKQAAILVVAVAAGATLSLFTSGGGHPASPSPPPAPVEARPAALPSVPSCPPPPPALVPDVVLAADPPSERPAGEAAAPALAPAEDPPRKPTRRKAKVRKAKAVEEAPAGETIVVPDGDGDGEPRKRPRRRQLDL